jgi:hypothetical protein
MSKSLKRNSSRIISMHRLFLFVAVFIFITTHYVLGDIKIINIENAISEGESIKFEDNQIVLSSKGLTSSYFSYNNITAIIFSQGFLSSKSEPNSFRITFSNKDVLYGTISDSGKNGFVLFNNLLGKVEINLEDIVSMERVGDKITSYQISKNPQTYNHNEDTILLISGDTDTGVIISLNPATIVLKSSLYNKEMAYKMSEIKDVSFFHILSQKNTTDIQAGSRNTTSFPIPKPFGAVVYLIDNSRINGSIQSHPEKDNFFTLLSGSKQYHLQANIISFIYFKNSRFIWLSDLEPIDVKVYPSNYTSLWYYQKDRSLFSEQPISLIGIKYFKGLAVHSNCELTYQLNGDYQKFFAIIGLTDDIPYDRTPLGATVKFIVYLNDKKFYESDVFRRTTPPQRLSIDLKNMQKLKLVINDADDGYVLDRACWALARITK